MKAIKVDDAHRIQLPALRPGDLYQPEFRGENEITLRRVLPPKRQWTEAQALAALKASPLRFTVSWDELKSETR